MATLEVFGFWTRSPESFVAVVETPWAAHFKESVMIQWLIHGGKCLIVISLMVLMAEPSALHVLGKCSITVSYISRRFHTLLSQQIVEYLFLQILC